MRWRLKSPASRLFTELFNQGADQKKHQSSASLVFVRGIHRWPMNSPHKRPVTRKMFPFYLMTSSWMRKACSCHDVVIWVHFTKRRAMSSGGGPCHQALGHGVHNNRIHNVIEGPSRKLFPWQPMPHNWLAPLCSGKAPHTLEYQLSWFANLAHIIAESFRWLSTSNT